MIVSFTGSAIYSDNRIKDVERVRARCFLSYSTVPTTPVWSLKSVQNKSWYV